MVAQACDEDNPPAPESLESCSYLSQTTRQHLSEPLAIFDGNHRVAALLRLAAGDDPAFNWDMPVPVTIYDEKIHYRW